MRLKEVHKVFNKWLNYEEEKKKRLELMLAVMLTRPLIEDKIWLIIIGASGDGKSEMLNAFDDGGFNTYIIQKLTPKTLISGLKGGKRKDVCLDLAPKLKNKVVLIPEFASLLTMPTTDKAQIWAQLRDLYDGKAGGHTGSGTEAKYSDLNVTLMGCSTPVIDSQILIHQSLGTRELLWRTEGNEDKDLLLHKITLNKKKRENMKLELRKAVQEFLLNKNFQYIEIDEDINKKLFKYGQTIALMRCPAEVDGQTGELYGLLYPEEPTRIFSQLQLIYMALKSLDEDYSEDRVFEIIDHIAESSGNVLRQNIFNFVYENMGETTRTIANHFKIGYKAAYRELNVLNGLNLLKKEELDVDETKSWLRPITRWYPSDEIASMEVNKPF